MIIDLWLFLSLMSPSKKTAEEVLNATWQRFPSLAKNQIALTWLVYDEPIIVNTGGALSVDEFWKHPIRGYSYRGDENLYPASVVKLFLFGGC